ncbi:cyclin-U4-1-like [Olea europaea var. sylvestris]|uniref:cyclin-U4-1-like n=1 Tax=Olea europaea var. sylvestris TaxID=158386 RepID=UPI000C1CD6AF|nr:cyclin-U4-1-like [Olea europaea var. sylvestris]
MADFENSQEIPKVITFLSSLLQRVAETNDVFRCLDSQKISIFHGLTRPTISLNSYLQRIFKYANCSPSCYITAYIYLERFTQKQPLLPINSFNVHRLLITSVLVSAKFMDDVKLINEYKTNNKYKASIETAFTAVMLTLMTMIDCGSDDYEKKCTVIRLMHANSHQTRLK